MFVRGLKNWLGTLTPEQRITRLRIARYGSWSTRGLGAGATYQRLIDNVLLPVYHQLVEADMDEWIEVEEPLLNGKRIPLRLTGHNIQHALLEGADEIVSFQVAEFMRTRASLADEHIELWESLVDVRKEQENVKDQYCRKCYQITDEQRYSPTLGHWLHPDYEYLCSNHSRILPCAYCGGDQRLPYVRSLKRRFCAGCPFPFICPACNEVRARLSDWSFEPGMIHPICIYCHSKARKDIFEGKGYWCFWCGHWQPAVQPRTSRLARCQFCIMPRNFSNQYCHRCGEEYSNRSFEQARQNRIYSVAEMLGGSHSVEDAITQATAQVLQEKRFQRHERLSTKLCTRCLASQREFLLARLVEASTGAADGDST